MQSPTCLKKSWIESLGDFLNTSCSQRNLSKIEGLACGRKHVLTLYIRREVTFSKHSREAQWAHVALHVLVRSQSALILSPGKKYMQEKLIQGQSWVCIRSGCYLCIFERDGVHTQPVDGLNPELVWKRHRGILSSTKATRMTSKVLPTIITIGKHCRGCWAWESQLLNVSASTLQC